MWKGKDRRLIGGGLGEGQSLVAHSFNLLAFITPLLATSLCTHALYQRCSAVGTYNHNTAVTPPVGTRIYTNY